MYKLILLVLFPYILSAQDGQVAKINFTPNQGLPSSEVYDLLQDRNGYIWIATDNGVSRFNGYRFDNSVHKRSFGKCYSFFI